MSKVVFFDSKGPSGNIFWVMGAASTKLKEEGRADDARKMCDRVRQQDSYGNALKVISEYVTLIDLSDDCTPE